jgi:4-hydroxybenzoate polyprenyltransferase
MYLARVDKPIGTMLLFWPCCWGVALAAPMGALPDLLLMVKFFTGAFIMRGAGCTINDLWDRDFDGKVERTKSRPLVNGSLKPIQALTFLGGQLLTGLGILLTFNQASIVTALASMPLVVVYPLMKRYTYCPQLILGMTFNWGVWVGWTAVHDSLNFSLLAPLYGAGICWTLVYDTLYGYQDRSDDKKIGVKSFALFLGDHPQWPFTAITAGMIGGMLTTGYLADLSSWYYIGVLGHIAPAMLHQIWTAQLDNSKNLWDKFKSNNWLGASITGWIAAGHFPGIF